MFTFLTGKNRSKHTGDIEITIESYKNIMSKQQMLWLEESCIGQENL